ncbi:MAG TPA: PAS domain S-box protein, partial [Anaerolineales bacterium]|nr:PAS domain S-box protein [Anaerolineales bacterium]
DLAGYSLDEAIQRVRSGDNPVWKCEHRIRHRSGEIRWIFEAAVELRHEDGVSHGSIGMYQDITESKQAEAALRRGEERYRGIFEGVQDAILVESTDGRILDVNQRACEMFGYSREAFLTKKVNDLIPAGQPAIADDEGSLEAISHGPVETIDIRANGEEFPVEISGRLYDFDNQKVFLVVLRDITERKQAEKAMRDRDQSYKTLIDQTPAIVYIDDSSTDPGRTQFISPYIQTMLGFTPEEWIKGGEALWKDRLHAEDRERVLAEYDRSIQTTAPLSLEYRVYARDGRVVWVHDQATTLRDDTGKPQAVHGVMYDITERKKSEEALLESEKRFSSAFAHAPIGMALVALDGHWLKTNQALSELTGYTEQELLRKTFQDITHPDDLEADLNYAKQLLAGTIRSYQMEKRYIHKNGKIVWALLSGSLILDKTSRPLYFIAQIQDITQRRESQIEINHQLSELEALYENGLAISRLLEPKQIARRIVQVLDQKMKWHHAAVRILQPESGQLELLALSQPGLDEIEINQQLERVNEFNINLDYGLSGWVVKHRTAFRSGNLKQNPNYVETYPGIKSGLYVPIRSGEEVIGSIAVESEQEDAFAQGDERLLLTLANQAAISFVNARLYERLQHELIERRRTEDQILKLNVELEQRVQERTHEIETTHQRLELAAASSGIGVWELKSAADSLYWDERMHGIYGTLPERFTPTLKNWLELIHPEDRAGEAEKTSRAIAQPGTYQSEFRIIREDGSIRYVSSHAMVLVDEQQKFKDMIGVHMDITTIKQAEETLRMANSELERALRVKDEFLANMSHELRTPLNAILGLSESLEEQIIGSLNEKQQRYIHTISESGHHLLTLINDILDLAKIEAGQIRLDINRVDIHAVCQSSLRMVKQLAQKKNQQVGFEIDEKLNLIWADERRLKQMMV